MLWSRFVPGWLAALVVLPCLAQTAPPISLQPPSARTQAQSLTRLQAGVTALQHWYVERTGLYRSTGWWNAANAITVLTDAMRVTGSQQYAPVSQTRLSAHRSLCPKPSRPAHCKP